VNTQEETDRANLAKIVEVAKALPETKEEILALFEKEEIKGKQTDVCHCLFAEWFSKHAGFKCKVTVRSVNGMIRYQVGALFKTDYLATYLLSEAAHDVGLAFDRNELPSQFYK
jgi:hypothetical protein